MNKTQDKFSLPAVTLSIFAAAAEGENRPRPASVLPHCAASRGSPRPFCPLQRILTFAPLWVIIVF